MKARAIIAVDVCGTLTKSVCFTPSEVRKSKPIKGAVKRVNELFDKGFVVILTARKDELIGPTVMWLHKHGFKYHAISNYKMPFDKYIDNDAEKL